MSQLPVMIGVAGGTGSGKTSIANKLVHEYGSGEVIVIEQDSYYKDLSHLDYDERTQQNFDHPDSIEFDLLVENMRTLLDEKPVDIPEYDFTTHLRKHEAHRIIPHHVIIIEGILVLNNPGVRDLLDIKIFVDTPADIRFIRRLTRDMQERERTRQSVIDQYLLTVRPMHEQFVEPSKYFADIIIPEGGENKVAIDLLRTKIDTIIRNKTT